MPTHSEAIRLNIEYYRKQAKALLKAVRSADPGAFERFSRQAVQFDSAAPKLQDAQLALAREQGFPSWPRFRAFLVQSGLSDQGLAIIFIEADLSDLRRAEAMLSANPQIA